MKRPSTSLPNFGTEPLLVEPQAALGDLKPVLATGTELLKRYNSGEDFAYREYEHWFGQFRDAAIRCFGQRSSAAMYFQPNVTTFKIVYEADPRVIAYLKAQGLLNEGQDRDDAISAYMKAQGLPKQGHDIFVPDEKFEAIDRLRPVTIERLRNEVATLRKWVRNLERQVTKKPL